MSRKDFAYLLEKYNEGTCTEEEKKFVEHWYAVTQNEDRQHLDESDLDAMEPVMWQEIQNRIQTDQTAEIVPLHPSGKLPSFRWTAFRRTEFRWTAIAASVIILLGVFFMLRNKEVMVAGTGSEVRAGWLKKTNTSAEKLLVTLPDGSEVNLSPNSSIEYPNIAQNNKREVYLTGDAFFEIQKSKTKPFFVYTGKVVTKVLGTSFFVRAQNENKQVSVEVVTGRVAVFEKSEKETSSPEVVLTPNQKTVYMSEEKQFVTSLVDAPKPIVTTGNVEKPVSYEFADEPLRNVIDRLSNSYGIKIELETENLGECPLTANLSNLPLYAQLDMICAATKSNYTLKGTTILIGGKGCANIQ